MAGRSYERSVKKALSAFCRQAPRSEGVSAYKKCKIIIKFNRPLLTFSGGFEIISVICGRRMTALLRCNIPHKKRQYAVTAAIIDTY